MLDSDKTIYAYLTGRLSTWEVRELFNWINATPENKQTFQVLCEYWEKSSIQITLDEKEVNKAYDKLSSNLFDSVPELKSPQVKRINPNNRKAQFWWMSAAASILLLLSALLFDFNSINHQNEGLGDQLVTKENPKGRKSQVFLPDGTKVWINAYSRITYDKNFGVDNRNLELKGEAYFEVEKNEKLPFKVVTDKIIVTALGTAFNVRNYKEEAISQVLLQEGKVKVEGIDNSFKDQYLTHGESLMYSETQRQMTKQVSDFSHLISWREGVLLFKEASREEVISALERWYGVDVQVLNDIQYEAWKYTSRFEGESLENVLKSMSHVKKFQFEIDKKTVKIIYSN